MLCGTLWLYKLETVCFMHVNLLNQWSSMLALYNTNQHRCQNFNAGIDAPSLDIKNIWSQNNTDIKVFNLGFNPTSVHVKKKMVCMQTNTNTNIYC